ncbi:MAG: methylenetetrahydrofolate reductase [NAD(P)H] [Actinobacteria bacterium]|nr:methylenetetrahydrofolate reductase [NAD(P)H] [Actinomycetota bacterium]MCB9388077.1 methylenetetrahydrofolate reductase [NAD(P)H] [Acidimicrobiia bacterium]
MADVLTAGPTFSFEFFPPRDDDAQVELYNTLRDLQTLDPSFVSVTYGAGGSTRDRTHDLVVSILNDTTMTPMAHLTCVAHSRAELADILERYDAAGVENILALGGDPPADGSEFRSELEHAIDLVELVRSVGNFSIGVAAHPEGHPRSPDRISDRKHLAAKLALADFAITQFFFDAEDYFGMIDELADLGVTKPVVPGIMPVTNVSQVTRFAQLSGAAFPTDLAERLHAAGDPDEVRRIGIDVATELCRTLLDGGAPGLHFYTLNKSPATREIYQRLASDGYVAATRAS